MLALLLISLVACNKTDTTGSAGDAASAIAEAPAAASGNAITFVSTQDDKPFAIDTALFVTPAGKEFLTTGKNPYVGNEEAIAKPRQCRSAIPGESPR